MVGTTSGGSDEGSEGEGLWEGRDLVIPWLRWGGGCALGYVSKYMGRAYIPDLRLGYPDSHLKKSDMEISKPDGRPKTSLIIKEVSR